MTKDDIKKEVRKIEKYYDYNHETEDYDVLVNLSEIVDLISNIERAAYQKGVEDAKKKTEHKRGEPS